MLTYSGLYKWVNNITETENVKLLRDLLWGGTHDTVVTIAAQVNGEWAVRTTSFKLVQDIVDKDEVYVFIKTGTGNEWYPLPFSPQIYSSPETARRLISEGIQHAEHTRARYLEWVENGREVPA
jgi:hypothetical protein